MGEAGWQRVRLEAVTEVIDCEALRDGFLAQPVNTLSASAFVAAAVLVVRAPGSSQADRWFALVLAATGVGSAVFHASPSPVTDLAHDAPIVALLSARPLRLTGSPVVAALAAAALVGAVAANALFVSSVAGLVAMAVYVEARRGPAASRRDAALAFLVAIGGVAWLFGRTGSPLCTPESLLQPHALWHVLAASVAVLWWRRGDAIPRRSRGPAGSRRA